MFVERFIEVVVVGDFGDDFWVEVVFVVIVIFVDIVCVGVGMVGVYFVVVSFWYFVVLIKFDGGDGLIDWVVRCDLDNKKVNGDDGL